jgi:hypothetical protein
VSPEPDSFPALFNRTLGFCSYAHGPDERFVASRPAELVVLPMHALAFEVDAFVKTAL